MAINKSAKSKHRSQSIDLKKKKEHRTNLYLPAKLNPLSPTPFSAYLPTPSQSFSFFPCLLVLPFLRLSDFIFALSFFSFAPPEMYAVEDDLIRKFHEGRCCDEYRKLTEKDTTKKSNTVKPRNTGCEGTNKYHLLLMDFRYSWVRYSGI